MSNEKVKVLWDTFQKTRDLSRYYLSLLKEFDPYQPMKVNNVSVNSVCWMVGHLAWAEVYLLIKATGGKFSNHEWLDHYALGSDGSLHEEKPEFKNMLAVLKEVHEAAQLHIQQLSDEDLEKDNPLELAFGPDKSIRIMIQHAIRHEGTHVGHLSWLVKLNGGSAI